MTVVIDNWRWAGVPFVLQLGQGDGGCPPGHPGDVQAGAAPAHRISPASPGHPQLRLSLETPRLDLDLVINGEGNPFELERVALSTQMHGRRADRLRRGAPPGSLEGDPVLSVRGDVAEQCWRIVEPVLHAWEADRVPLETYPAGSTWPPLPVRKESHD